MLFHSRCSIGRKCIVVAIVFFFINFVNLLLVYHWYWAWLYWLTLTKKSTGMWLKLHPWFQWIYSHTSETLTVTLTWWYSSWLYSFMVLLSFLLLLPHNAKAPGGGRKVQTIPLPQMRSMTPTRALLNPNVPNLLQLPKALAASPAPSQWSHCAPGPGPKTLKMRIRTGRPFKIGQLTAQRSLGTKTQDITIYCIQLLLFNLFFLFVAD